MRISRRRFLAGSGAAGALAAAAGLPFARRLLIRGAAPAELRLVGWAPAREAVPLVQPLHGLAGFDRRLAEIGARGLRWAGPPAGPDETALLVAGFEPSAAWRRGGSLRIEGRPDPRAVRVVAVGTRVPARGRAERMVVREHPTPAGTIYREVVAEANPGERVTVALVEAGSGVIRSQATLELP